MSKKLFIALGLLVVLMPAFSMAVAPSELQHQIETVKRERDVLLEEQKKLQAELTAINQESQTLGSAVQSLDATRKKLLNDISITQSKIKSSNLTIDSLENTITDKERQIITHRLALATTLQALHTYDSRSLLADVLVYPKLSDIWEDEANLAGLTGTLEIEIGYLRDTTYALNEEKREREKTKAELVDFQQELGGQKEVVEETKSAKERLLNETKSKEAEYQKLLADNIARQKESEADLFQLESELRIALDPSLLPDKGHGLLSWPLDNVFITQSFGKTVGGEQLYAQGFHNGVDFRASMGTPVRAVAAGTIAGTDNTDRQRGCYSYGRWILVRHNNGLSTIYAHLSSSLVKSGQTVAEGQIIGYSGGSPGTDGAGYSTGPHLHLGLFATQGVEIRQFTTSKGCKEVFVPIAKGVEAYLDPLAYLPSL